MSPAWRTVALWAGMALALAAAPAAHALYDPAPQPALAAAQGGWVGTLTYKDHAPGGALVTLPARVNMALTDANTLALHYLYDDGPAKLVHAYDHMRWSAAADTLTWTSGLKPGSTRTWRRTSPLGAAVWVFEPEGGTKRVSLTVTATQWEMLTEELDASGSPQFRSRVVLRRP